MNKRASSRPLLLLLAAAFLFESWFWQGCIALGRRIVALIPWAALKARIAAVVAILPAPLVLVIFLIPVAIIEPMQTVCVYLIARGYVVSGILGFVALKFFGLGLIAVMFDLTREKLLSMPWFAWVYAKFVAFHAFAARSHRALQGGGRQGNARLARMGARLLAQAARACAAPARG